MPKRPADSISIFDSEEESESESESEHHVTDDLHDEAALLVDKDQPSSFTILPWVWSDLYARLRSFLLSMLFS